MKLAKLDELARNDSSFQGGEPNSHYEYRQVIVVADGYDFETNNATDVSSVLNWIAYNRKVLNRPLAATYMQAMFSDWANDTQSDKDAFLDFIIQSAPEPCVVSSLQIIDLGPLIWQGFEVFQNGGTNVLKYWDGSAWQTE